MDGYWRAANYLPVGQTCLCDNPLLRKPLNLAHIKPAPVRPLRPDGGTELRARISSGRRTARSADARDEWAATGRSGAVEDTIVKS